jgi:hypothetical protein
MLGVAQNVSPTREQKAAQDAQELILFADGAEEAGLIQYARRARNLARERFWLAQLLEAERSARKTIQEARDRLLEQVTRR